MNPWMQVTLVVLVAAGIVLVYNWQSLVRRRRKLAHHFTQQGRGRTYLASAAEDAKRARDVMEDLQRRMEQDRHLFLGEPTDEERQEYLRTHVDVVTREYGGGAL